MSYAAGNLTLNIYLAPVPGAGASLTTVMYLVDEALGNGLNGDRTRTYASVTDVTDDATALYITAAVSQALQDAFAQSPTPKEIKVGRIDTGGGETYATGFTAVKADDPDFYGVVIDKRSNAEILLVSGAVETDAFRIFFLQSADADWLTAGYPAALTAIEDRERSVICYHDIAAEVFDLCWAVHRLNFDPDDRSVGWPCNLKEVADYTTAVTSAQKVFAEANDVNLGEEWGSASFWVDGGWNANHRPIDQIVSADWFSTRLEEDLVTFIQAKSARGEKIPVSVAGQNMILGIIRARLQAGLAAHHFYETQKTDGTPLPLAEGIAITAADITAQRLRFNVEAIFETGARVFTLNIYLAAVAP